VAIISLISMPAIVLDVLFDFPWLRPYSRYRHGVFAGYVILVALFWGYLSVTAPEGRDLARFCFLIHWIASASGYASLRIVGRMRLVGFRRIQKALRPVQSIFGGLLRLTPGWLVTLSLLGGSVGAIRGHKWVYVWSPPDPENRMSLEDALVNDAFRDVWAVLVGAIVGAAVGLVVDVGIQVAARRHYHSNYLACMRLALLLTSGLFWYRAFMYLPYYWYVYG
jgi:hypothetical protein